MMTGKNEEVCEFINMAKKIGESPCGTLAKIKNPHYVRIIDENSVETN